jgi:hypothetical protein
MSTRVDLSTRVVKNEGEQRCVGLGRQYGMTVTSLAERISWVLRNRKDVVTNESAWSVKAGLARTHVNGLRRRLREDASSGVELETLRKLANAAEVSVEWFAHGTGAPDVLTPVAVDDDAALERNNTLAIALGRRRNERRWLSVTVEAAKLFAVHGVQHDPGEGFWTQLLDEVDAVFRSAIRDART